MKPTYSWNRHHAWGALGILSLFSGLHALVPIPPWLTYSVGSGLVLYALVFIVRTYRSAGELKEERPPPADAAAAPEKAVAKLEKKRLKTQAKLEKKRRKEE